MTRAFRLSLELAILESYRARGWSITGAEVSLLASWAGRRPTFALWCYRASLPHLPVSASLDRS